MIPTTTLPAVGQRLRVLRVTVGLTQIQLAERAGLHSQTVERAEREGFVTPRTARKLGSVLGVEADELLAAG